MTHTAENDAPGERPCFACGHIHDPKSPGKCWEAACLPNCPEDHNDFDGVFPYTPDTDTRVIPPGGDHA